MAARRRPQVDGARRQPREAPRPGVPVLRDLRRLPLDLGLRAARRAAQAQREGRVVALDGAAPRRRRRSRRRDPHGARRSGRRAVTSPRSPTRSSTAATARSASAPTSFPSRARARTAGEGHLHRGPQLQPDVQDARRSGRERHVGRVPPARDRAGHLRQLQERADHDAQEAAVRYRADRQVVPQRDHARQLHLPHARVRADGDGVLRPARRSAEVVRVLGRRALPLVHRPRHPRGQAAHPPARDRRALALLGRHERPRVRLPVGLGRARRHRQPRRLRPHPAPEVLGRGPLVLRPGERRALPAVRHRARRRRRPRDARVPARRVRRGRSPTGEGKVEKRTVLRLDPRLAPIKVAVLPLSKKDTLLPLDRRGRRRVAPALP